MAVGERIELSTRAINPSASLAGRCIQPALPPNHSEGLGTRTLTPLITVTSDFQDRCLTN